MNRRATEADVWENMLDDANWSFEQDQADWTPTWADGGSYTWTLKVHGERHYSIRRRPGEGIDGYALSPSHVVPAEAGRSYRARATNRQAGDADKYTAGTDADNPNSTPPSSP